VLAGDGDFTFSPALGAGLDGDFTGLDSLLEGLLSV